MYTAKSVTRPHQEQSLNTSFSKIQFKKGNNLMNSLLNKVLLSVFVAAIAMIATIQFSAAAAYAQGRDIRKDPVYPGGPTYEQTVQQFMETYVFPPRAEYKGFGVKRVNVKVRKIERNGNNFWITVSSKYRGTIGGFETPISETAYIHYNNGHIRADVGGIKGIVNTEALWDTIVRQLQSGNPGGGGWRICNKSSDDKVWVAYSYLENGSWVNKGWRTIERGQCSVILNQIKNRYVYYYAKSNTGEWSGDVNSCVHPTNKFTLSDDNCRAPNEFRGFVQVDTGNNAQFTTNLVD